jgi:hypothetical protein
MLIPLLLFTKSRATSVVQRWAKGWTIGVRVPLGTGNFSLHHSVQTGSEAHPTTYPMATRGSFSGGKADGREANHLHSSSAEVKNSWSYTSTPPKRLHGVVLS